MREELALSLYEAEEMLATDLGYTLSYKYQTDRDHVLYNPITLRWARLVGGGVRARTEITPSASDFTTDPATITVAQSDFPGGTSEIVIIEDSTGFEIEWDSVATSGTDYVISIDQCKLIEFDNLEDQRDTAINYDATFPAATWLGLDELTVYREYRDVSDQATIIFGPRCSCWFASGEACTGVSYDACIWAKDFENSIVAVQSAEYIDTTWSHSSIFLTGCYEGDRVEVNYLAGTADEPGYKKAILGLAHALISFEPCGCSGARLRWTHDNRIPNILTAERINCPYGLKEGAWYAWNWMMSHQSGQGISASHPGPSPPGEVVCWNCP